MGDLVQKFILQGEDKTGAALKSCDRNLGNVTRAVMGLNGGLVGLAGSSVTLAASLHKLGTTAQELDDLSETAHGFGLLTDQLDALDYAAGLSSVGVEGLHTGLKGLAKSMYEAATDSGSKAAEMFRKLGVEAVDSAGRMRLMDAVLLDVAGVFPQLRRGAEQGAAAVGVFGRAGKEMVDFLQQGREPIENAIIQAHALGTRYEDLAADGERYTDAQLKLNRSLRSVNDAVFRSALPAVAALSEVMADKAVTAVTGLDRQFREFIGTLRVLPADTALEQLEQKILETEAALAAARERAANKKSFWSATAQEWDAQVKLNKQIDTYVQKLAALATEKNRLLTQQDVLAAQGQEYLDLLEDEGAAQDAANKLAQDARRIVEGALGPLGQLELQYATLNEARAVGLVLDHEYLATVHHLNRAWQDARDKLNGATAAEQAWADLLRDSIPPVDQLGARYDVLNERRAAGMVTDQQYLQVLRFLNEEWRGLDTAAKDGGDKVADQLEATALAAQSAVRASTTGMGTLLRSMVDQGREDLGELERLALETADSVMEALWQALVVTRLTDAAVRAVTGAPAGASSSSSAAAATVPSAPVPINYGDLPGLPYEPLPMAKAAGGGAAARVVGGDNINVHLTVQALDTRAGVQVILENEAAILGLVQRAYNKRGQRGPLGR